ncbi:MAG TPA: VWA domain-containing protein [Pyrinomonadaceae bacterium]|jgi:VWFA-related protein|nr:VWA domain-containing protein [Pyrinomonadaceae bacterium]
MSVPSVRAQDEPPPPPPVARQTQETTETIRVDVELVDLNVSVFNREAQHPVGELQQKDFRVFENDIEQEISFFASAATPFDLVLLLDLSGSTADKLDLVRKSAQRFVEAARPVDRIGVVTFTNVAHVVSPLTADRAELIKQIKKIKKPQGGTNFWDALRFVLERVLERKADAPERRSAVVVMTDGVDNALPDVNGEGSATSFEELLEIVGKSDAIVLPIYLDTEAEMVKQHRWFGVESTYVIARQQLAHLAAESGSLLYRARKLEDLKGVYEQVIRDLGTVYSLGYNPKNKQRDNSWRAINVQLVNRPELAARTRRGYFAK